MARFATMTATLLIGALGQTAQSVGAERIDFTVQKINDHVYAFITPDPTLDWVDGNSYAIVTDEGVFVVDAHQSSLIAETNIAEIRKFTDQPVKFLLNTHWHGDHNLENPVYKRAFPDIRILAHSKTREILSRRCPEWVASTQAGEYDTYLTIYQGYLDSAKDETGRPLTDSYRSRYERIVEILKRYGPYAKLDECLLPDMAFDNDVTLFMGSREIEIRHDGRANTPGDAYVWLPQDSILITGDILVHPIPYCFGSFYEEWVAVLDTMLALKPKVILPGHGEPMYDTNYLRDVRDALASLVEQGKRGYAQGIRNADTLRTFIDMSSYRTKFAGDDFDRNWAFDNFMIRPAVGRLLRQLNDELGDDKKAN
jgi:glyoxylase-like metal-dependent hydrolase (beta-lactamase superfamily II)